jgi:hypothetical protein
MGANADDEKGNDETLDASLLIGPDIVSFASR